MDKFQHKKLPNKKIGFVVNPGAGPDDQIAYILTTHNELQDDWDIWPVHCENDESKKRSVREYAQALFILFSHALPKASAEYNRTSSRIPAIRLSRTDNTYGPWVRHVFDVITTTKKYLEVPAAVRHGLKPLLAAVGRRGEKGRIEIASDCTQRIFFWDIKNEPFCSIDFEKCISDKTPLNFSPVVANSFELNELYTFSKRIRISSRAKTWMDLYRKYAIELSYTSSEKWLNIHSLEVENPSKSLEQPSAFQTATSQLNTKSLPIDFPNIMNRLKNVLLTGPAGSGKTTAFKLLATEWFCEEGISQEENLSFYVPLKKAEIFLKQCIADTGKIEIADLIGWSVISVLRNKCNEEELGKCDTIQGVSRTKNNRPTIFTRNEMLSHIQNEVVEWFENKGRREDHVLVLIDGINELNLQLRDMLKLKIKDLSGRDCKLAISCRSNFANAIFTDYSPQIKRFELQEVNETQIISYLEYNIPGRGKQIFDSQIKNDRRLFSMAKFPYYLFLIAERIKKDPTTKIPQSKAKLIDDFIHSLIKRKSNEIIHDLNNARDRIKDDMIYIVLPKVAKWSMDSLTLGKDDVTTSFRDSNEFKDIQTPNDTLITLEISEECGFLSFSGLFGDSVEQQDYPIFSHDNFRDFFAAKELRRAKGLSELPYLHDVLEYREWEGPLEIYFSMISNEKQLIDNLTTIAVEDVFLACRCLQWSIIASEKHAKMLLKYLPLERIDKISTGLSSFTNFDAHDSLARIFSFYGPDELLAMFWNLNTTHNIRAAISIAFVYALGIDAMPYLEKIHVEHGSECNIYALLGMKELETEEAWRWLCEEYICLAKKNNPNYEKLEEVITSEQFQLSPNVIMQMIQKAKQILEGKTDTYIYEHVVGILAQTLEKLGPEHGNTLLAITLKEEAQISEAATRALVKAGNKEVSMRLLKSLLTRIDSNKDGFYMNDIEALGKAHIEEIDSALWVLFEKHLNSPNPHPQLIFLPAYIAPRTNEVYLRKIINMVFEIDNGLSSTALRIFMDYVPEIVLAVARELSTTVKKHSFLWYRIVAARGYCGDKDVKADLIEIISNIDRMRYPVYKSINGDKLKERIIRDGFEDNFTYILFQAVKKLQLVEALPIIKHILKYSKSGYVKDKGSKAEEFLQLVSIKSIWQVRGVVRFLADNCIDESSLECFLENLSLCYNIWPEKLLWYLLIGLRDKIDEAEDTETSCKPELLYALLSWLREIHPKRSLDIFKGWPVLPYEYGACCIKCKRDFSQVKFAMLYSHKKGLCIDCLLTMHFPYDADELSNKLINQNTYYRRCHCDYCGEDYEGTSFVRVDGSIQCDVCWEQAIERIIKFRLIKEPISANKIEKEFNSSHPLRIIAGLNFLWKNKTLQSDKAMRAAINMLGIGGPSFLWQRVRQIACDTMVKIGERTLEYCLEATGSSNWRIKANIALIAGYFPRSKQADEILRQMVSDTNSNVRRWVIQSVCDRSDVTAKKILSILARDNDQEIAYEAKKYMT